MQFNSDIWNIELCAIEETGNPAKHFDYYKLITIDPDKYRELKNTMGDKITAMVSA